MRQIKVLSAKYDVTVLGFGDNPGENIKFIELEERSPSLLIKAIWAFKLFMGLFQNYYWNISYINSALRAVSNKKYDLVLANEVISLPFALKIADGVPVVLDAHEYYPRQFEDRLLWRMFLKKFNNYICIKYLKKAAFVTTVCQGIAIEYAEVYGIPKPTVIYNAPSWQGLSPRPVRPDNIRLIHHGASIPSRCLEVMIELMDFLDNRFSLDFMLVEANSEYLKKLHVLAAKNRKIRFLPPVAMPDISDFINSYDIGLFLLPPTNFNYKNALPNKFFEFIQANLAVAIGPSPEMSRLVDVYKCGVVSATFDPRNLADCLNGLTAEDIYRFKVASGEAAKELGFEKSADILLSEVGELLKEN